MTTLKECKDFDWQAIRAAMDEGNADPLREALQELDMPRELCTAFFLAVEDHKKWSDVAADKLPEGEIGLMVEELKVLERTPPKDVKGAKDIAARQIELRKIVHAAQLKKQAATHAATHVQILENTFGEILTGKPGRGIGRCISGPEGDPTPSLTKLWEILERLPDAKSWHDACLIRRVVPKNRHRLRT